MSRVFAHSPGTTYLTVTDAVSLRSLTEFTISAWVYVLDYSSENVLFAKAPGSDERFMDFNSLGISAYVHANFGNNAFSLISNSEIPIRTWAHIAMTFSNSGDRKIHIYVNGTERTYLSQIGMTGVGVHSDTGNLIIGGDSFTAPAFGGNIAEFAIWNAALSNLDVAAVAASTSGVGSIQPANLVGYWHLCGLDSPELDNSGHGNNAVLSANPPLPGPNSPGYSACFKTQPTVTSPFKFIYEGVQGLQKVNK